MNDSGTSLLDLPAEMLVAISDFLENDEKDVLCLRLVHSLLAAAADDAFARIAFRTRNHMFTTSSLVDLAEIIEKPSWARKVESIELCVPALDFKKFDIDKDNMPKHRTRAVARRTAIYDRFIEETQDEESLYDMLVDILLNLVDLRRDQGANVNITLTPAYSKDMVTKFSGFQQLLFQLGADACAQDVTSRGHGCDAAFIILMKALDDTLFTVTRLDLLMCRLSLAAFDRLLHEQPDSPHSWAALDMLHLGLRQPKQQQWCLPHTSALEDYFTEADSCTFLELTFGESPSEPLRHEHNSIRWLSTTSSHMFLHLLSLMDAVTTAADLIALTQEHGGLGALGLLMVNLPERECWSTVFSALSENNPNLEQLWLTTLTIGHGRWLSVFVDQEGDEEIEISGKPEEVASQLKYFARNPAYELMLWHET